MLVDQRLGSLLALCGGGPARRALVLGLVVVEIGDEVAEILGLQRLVGG